MLQTIIDFYREYPDNILSNLFGKGRSEIPDDLLENLLRFQRAQIHNLSSAQVFRLNHGAEDLLGRLINEMSREGLEDTFENVRLPFPVMLIERDTLEDGFFGVGLLTQLEGKIDAQFHAVNDGGLMPSLSIVSTATFPFTVAPTPTAELADLRPDLKELTDAITQDRTNAISLLSMGVGIATLLKHKSMLKVEEVSTHSRSERRRAARSGRSLPDILVSKISLGEHGKGQLIAMDREQNKGQLEGTKRRAHWVRGHWMRTAGGGLSFRSPHIRGAGPVTHERRVTE